MRAAVSEVLAALAPAHAEVLRLHYAEDLPVRAIARRVEAGEGAVRVRLVIAGTEGERVIDARPSGALRASLARRGQVAALSAELAASLHAQWKGRGSTP